MSEIKNPLEIYAALVKTNCGECGVPSCMAFAAAVLQGQKKIAACPYLDSAVVAQLSQRIVQRRSLEDDHQQAIEQLQQQVAALDFAEVAPRLGARLVDGNLGINCLGKDFFITPSGEMVS
ncbi:MAG: Fe-S cluster protein, partial [Proteobacteria bacterium]|nr:Fe-S cluster protein [Pseudomonadota bacterium]